MQVRVYDFFDNFKKLTLKKFTVEIIWCLKENDTVCLKNETCATEWMSKYNLVFEKTNERATFLEVRLLSEYIFHFYLWWFWKIRFFRIILS